MRLVRDLLGHRFVRVLALVRGQHVFTGTLVGLVGQDDESGPGEGWHDAPHPGRGEVVRGAGHGSTHEIVPVGLEMTCRFMPWPLCLPE